MRRLIQLVLALGVLAVVGMALSLGLFYALVLRDLPDIRSLSDYRPNLITRVYSGDGHVIGEFFKERREVVEIERIPTFVVQAFVAVEDDAFYEHEGLDYPGIARAFWANLRAGAVRQGGSTITQQVAKTFLLSSERSYLRKLKDMVLAKRIEEYLNKNEILYLYLNQIYLGSGAYGVEAAAKTYFDKSVEQLTLAEAALIAGVVPAPSRYTPFNSPELAGQRQRTVLRRMLEEGYITLEQHQAAMAEELQLADRTPEQATTVAAYFSEEVRRYLMDRFGADEVLTGGLTVRTTLDLERQTDAWETVRRGLRDHDRRTGYRGPVRVVEKEEREAVIASLATENGELPWKNGDIVQALVIEVDNKEETARLALGGGRETVLTLEDVAWARPPDTEIDGNASTLRRMNQALKPGYLVELEKIGEVEPEEGAEAPVPPTPEPPANPADGEAEAAGPDPEPEPVWPESLFALYQPPLAQGALLSLDLETSEVRAMIGGYDYGDSQFNRALQSKRQPGSAFKPIVYASALRSGYTPATTVYDTPIVWQDPTTGDVWKPENYSEKFYGEITLREAMARSRNIATVKVLQDIKVGPVLDLAESLGIRGDLEPNLALGLGASEVTLAELVRAYASFPTGGRWMEPLFILEVRDREGELLDENVPLHWKPEHEEGVEDPNGELDEELAEEEEELLEEIVEVELAPVDPNDIPLPEGHVMDPVTAYLMTDMLVAVVKEGTGWRAKRLGRPIGGKTGTTNNMHDAWFLGFSPRIVTGVWVGFDEARTLGKNESGSRAALPIWVDYMERALEGRAVRPFGQPPGIVYARVDKKSGLLAPAGMQEFFFQPFRDGTAPTEFAAGTNGSGPRRPRLD